MLNASRETIEVALYNLLTANQVFQGNLHGTDIVNGISPQQYQGLYFGEPISGANIPADTVIADLPTPGTIRLSNAATNVGDLTGVSLTAQIFKDSARRIMAPENVPAEKRPFLCTFPKPERHVFNGIGQPPTVTLEIIAFIYTSSEVSSPTSGPPPIASINPIIDALINIKLAPDLMTLRQTLGNDASGNPICAHAYVEGEVFKNGGDLDGTGIAIIPIKVLVPW